MGGWGEHFLRERGSLLTTAGVKSLPFSRETVHSMQTTISQFVVSKVGAPISVSVSIAVIFAFFLDFRAQM